MSGYFVWLPKELEQAAISGIETLGYKRKQKHPITTARQQDIFLAWTLWDKCRRRELSDNLAKVGAQTICFERGFLRGKEHWQVAWRVGNGTGFNGHGHFNAGGPERWAQMGFELKPWRADGRHILVCGNKGNLYEAKISKAINHDADWPDEICNRIAKLTLRQIHYRPHPNGTAAPCLPRTKVAKIIDTDKETLEQSLQNAWCTVVYASSAASTSIIEGVPVIYDGPKIMLQELASPELLDINRPPMPDRLPALERCAWAQWSLEEIASGAAFRQLGVPDVSR
jgi:hypothetical protein